MENEPPDATLALLIMTGLGAVIATEDGRVDPRIKSEDGHDENWDIGA